MYTKSNQAIETKHYAMPSHPASRTHSLVSTALFAAILCISAYISIPLPAGSHITFLNFIVMLIALTFSAKQSFCITLIWLLLGIIGVPVFVGGNAGISYIASGWGGYSIAFVLSAAFVPFFRGKKYNRLYYTILAIGTALLIDVFGAFWLMILTGISVKQAVLMGVLPFLPLDTLKAIVAAQILPQFKRITLS